MSSHRDGQNKVFRTAILAVLVAAMPATAFAAIRYVSTTGSGETNDCSDSGLPCATIQQAVDVADAGDELRVAAGSYSGSSTVTVRRFEVDYSYRQVVFIDRPLNLRGGYQETNWNVSDPQVNITTIDAAGDGRPVSVVDTDTELVTLSGFTLTGGDYTGMGNPPGTVNHVCRSRENEDCGGGLYVYSSTLELDQCVVSGNVASSAAGDGGGIYLWRTRAITLANVEVSNNEAAYSGGGLHAEELRFPLTISDSDFTGNSAGRGGGIALASSIEELVTIQRSSLSSNSATSGGGGGLYARLTSNGEMLALDELVISDNMAWEQGKGLRIDSAGPVSPQARLTNLLLSGNGPEPGAPESGEDAVLALGPGFTDLDMTLTHLTAAGNAVDTFMYIQPSSQGARTITVNVFNTLLSGFVTGFAARETGDGEASVTHTNTLFHEVGNQHLALEGTPEFVAINPLAGEPMLDGSYRLQAGSAALDQGIDAGISRDLDGEHRPQGLGPDIGADEYLQLAAPVSVNLSGPLSVDTGIEAVFLAEVSPQSATQPLTYAWSATDLDPVSRPGGLSDTAGFTWLEPGTKTVTVIVSNAQGETSESWQVKVSVNLIFSNGFESANGVSDQSKSVGSK